MHRGRAQQKEGRTAGAAVSRRQTRSIAIDDKGWARFVTACQEAGATQKDVMTSLAGLFAAQELEVRQLLSGKLAAHRRDDALEALFAWLRREYGAKK